MRARHWLLVAAALVLALAGPVMAWQELSYEERDAAIAELTGEPAPFPEVDFRAPGRTAVFAAVVVLGAAGTWASVAVARVPRVRSASGRLLFLMLLGMTIADLAFLVDVRALAEAPYRTRASFVSWIYPAAAILVTGSTLRLAEVEDAFGHAPRPALAR